MTDPGSDPAAVAGELKTVRDFLRFAVSRFTEAKLVYGHGTTNAHDEAAFLILEGLHLPVDELEPYADARLTRAERETIAALIHARVTTRKPAPYLVNRAYIQGVGFFVDERVIVPRSYIGEILADPELIGGESALLIKDADAVASLLDLCTGSGCLGILAALAFPNAAIDAVDVSRDALDVAAMNVTEFDLASRVRLIEGDLFASLTGRRYDLILANPPYVDARAMAALPAEYRHEPALALAGGEDGLDIVRRIVAGAAEHLNPEGALLCEIGRDRPAFESAFPTLELLWVETEESSDEAFWATAAALNRALKSRPR